MKTGKLFDYYQEIARILDSAQALRACGMTDLFKEGSQSEEGMLRLIDAMDGIRSCGIGDLALRKRSCKKDSTAW